MKLECETEKGGQGTEMIQSGSMESNPFFLASERRLGGVPYRSSHNDILEPL